ncbi:MAG: EAL domain-containing protein [Methyloglobulus sp.]|nr:diguanylate cyclase [Methyloglobulus sp.]
MVNVKKSVGILLPAMRISFALVLLTACLILSADFLGFIPDESKFLLAERKKTSEALAIQFTIFAPEQDPKHIEKMLNHITKRNPEIESAGIRLKNGQLIYQINDHSNRWGNYDKEKSMSTHLIVPILQRNETWGNIELKFFPLRTESNYKFYMQPIFKICGFVLTIGFFTYLVFMLRALRILDPSSVIPHRVNAAFDTLSESIVIIDEHEQILLANKVFTEKLSRPASSLLGAKLSSLKWKSISNSTASAQGDFPWQKVLNTGKSFIGAQLILAANNNNDFKFIINCSPIQNDKSVTQGVLITLDDVTELEKSYNDLQVMVNRLEETQVHIEQQNKELNFLATRDSLTGCLNRRSFNDLYGSLFKEAQQNDGKLSFIMADIDYFKKVNDNYGHATGDTVIQLFSEILTSNTRKIDLVGRYGGEEFSLALPGLSEEEAFVVAERIRLRLKDESKRKFANGPRVTASFGISSLKNSPANPDELQKYADEALYDAKESGRNRVSHWQLKTESVPHADSTTQSSQKSDETFEPDSRAKLQSRVDELETIATQFSAELEYTKHYDAITGLPNHVLFYDRINQVIERGNRHDQFAAILIVDIGLLGQINTTFGRSFGDKMLAEIAERIKNTFRKYDAISRLTISRFGGDEFAILLTDLATKETLTWIVMRLQQTLTEPLDIDGNNVFITNHVGISLYPSDANSAEDLINNAMLAKKYSKQHHSESHYQFFDEQMHKLSLKHVNLDKELRDSILYENWLLLYQPKMDIKSKAIVGVEALIRWNHPTRGILSPYEFIEFAEQRGLITAIGDWVIKTACSQIQEWMSLGLDCKVSVNVSAMQLKEEDFVGKVIRTLTAYGVPPRQLELELTESTLMNNFDIALPSLKRLNSSGIKIAIDDFGTGYSSLGYLKNLPINILKIDRIFIKDICNDDNDKQIVQALISMAHSMNMKVIAEGVEEKNQLDLLAKYHCDEIQGYLLSKPISSHDITEMLIKPNKPMF